MSGRPSALAYPQMSYDESRQKLFLFPSIFSADPEGSVYWEWDPFTATWSSYSEKELQKSGRNFYVAYDSRRQRQIVLTDIVKWVGTEMASETWEYDPIQSTWYVQTLSGSPPSREKASVTFDSDRGVVILTGGLVNGVPVDEVWEYSVRQLTDAGMGVGGAPSLAGGTTGNGGSQTGGNPWVVSAGGNTGQGGSMEGGHTVLVPDDGGVVEGRQTGSFDGATDRLAQDGRALIKMSNSGCACQVGQSSRGGMGVPWGLMGIGFLGTLVARRRYRR